MNDQSLLHIALIYLAAIRSSYARLLPTGRKNVVTFLMYGVDKAASKRGQSQARLSYAERGRLLSSSEKRTANSQFSSYPQRLRYPLLNMVTITV